MAISLSDNLQINAPKNIDARLYNGLTPYISTDQVTGSIMSEYRYKGLTVYVSSSTGVNEYWFKDGIADTDLILKSVNPTFPYSGSAVITGSLLISGSGLTITGALSVTNGITGSLQGTSSWASNAITASYITASNVYGPYGSNSVLSSSYAVTASYVQGVFSSNFTASFTNLTSITITHNLGNKYVIIQVFDDTDNQILPSEITLVDENSSTITFSSSTSGTVVATLGGASFLNSQMPAGDAYTVQYNDGGGSFGGSSNFTFDGNNFILYNNDGSAYALETNTSKYYTNSQIFDNRQYQESFLQSFISDLSFPAGEETPNITSPDANIWDLVFLDTDGTWKTASQTTTRATRLLGINSRSGNILIEGYVALETDSVSPSGDFPTIAGTSIRPGMPVYIKENATEAPFLSTDVPTNTGGFVRILGHILYENGSGYFIMRFRPDHTWVEID